VVCALQLVYRRPDQATPACPNAGWGTVDERGQTALSLHDVAASGDRRATLESLRQILAASIDEVDAAQRPALAKQFREVLSELETLPAGEVSVSDDLRSRRAARRATAAIEASSG